MDQVADRVYGHGVNEAVLGLVQTTHRTVLDVGCGVGGNAEIFAKAGKVVDGVTISSEEAHEASAWCRTVFTHDVELGLPESVQGPYDLCLCSHVIEHVRNPTPLLNSVHRVLSPDGLLLVALPNILQYKHRWDLCRGRFDYQEWGIMDSTHVRWYTWESGKKLLESHNFSVIRRVADGGFPLSSLRAVLPGPAVRFLDRFALTTFPGLFGWQHLFLARRA